MDLQLISEQIILIATVLGAVAALPIAIEFWIDRRKRQERVALSLEILEVKRLNVRLAGLDSVLEDIADLIDRARNPQAYESLKGGNEFLIIGPPLTGKKSLAQKIAVEAEMDKLLIVYNPRNVDALVRAKTIITSAKKEKIMLLLPRVDMAFEREDEEVLTELDALIETSSELVNVLVAGTAVKFSADSAVDNLFGIKLVLPGSGRVQTELCHTNPEVSTMLGEVAAYYLREAVKEGYSLQDITEDQAKKRILSTASNPAEVQDIMEIAKTTSLYQFMAKQTLAKELSLKTIEKAISRVTVNLISKDSAQERAAS